MATINPVWRVLELPNNTGVYGAGAAPTAAVNYAPQLVSITWTNAASATADVCTAAPCGWLVDKSVQFEGTVTSAAILGSNDGTNFEILNDPQGNALTAVNAAKIEQLLENTWLIKPTITTGTVTFTIFGRVPVV